MSKAMHMWAGFVLLLLLLTFAGIFMSNQWHDAAGLTMAMAFVAGCICCLRWFRDMPDED